MSKKENLQITTSVGAFVALVGILLLVLPKRWNPLRRSRQMHYAGLGIVVASLFAAGLYVSIQMRSEDKKDASVIVPFVACALSSWVFIVSLCYVINGSRQCSWMDPSVLYT